jgi:hypothetical protein
MEGTKMYQQTVKLLSLKNGFTVNAEERKNAKQHDPLEVVELIKKRRPL